MEKKWVQVPGPDEGIVADLARSINLNPVLASLLVQRGVQDFDSARRFFRPSLEQLHDPFLMADMEKAVNRLSVAIDHGEKILVYGDYDVDGTTSVALVYSFLSDLTPNLDYYIPDRYAEGYGISTQGVDWAGKEGFDLIIALDCGIKANEQVEQGVNLGIDFIICDHHRPGTNLPLAKAILDPQRDDCEYPYEDLCGCGVGFKLIQGYCLRKGIELARIFKYLDLVAVAISSDLVPLTGENRVLSFFGIKKLNLDPMPGLKALKKVSRQGKEVTVTGIVFGLGPRINAAGRIKHARASVQLLLSQGGVEALELAEEVDTDNSVRREYDSATTEEAIELIESDQKLLSAKTTVLYKPEWHKGIIGIVASRCIEKYYRPTIILTRSNGKITGSARSIEGFDIHKALTQCADLLEHFGGHKYAAGMTLDPNKLADFKARFEEVVARQITQEILTPKVVIDQSVDLDLITYKFFNVLKQMAPFGPGNMDPIFLSHQVYLDQAPKLIKDRHIKCFLKQAGGPAGGVEAIGFGMADVFPKLRPGRRFDVAFNLSENEFMDQKSLILVLKDIKFID